MLCSEQEGNGMGGQGGPIATFNIADVGGVDPDVLTDAVGKVFKVKAIWRPGPGSCLGRHSGRGQSIFHRTALSPAGSN